MDLMDLLTKSGGGNSIGELAKVVGLGESDASSLIGALSPALISGIQKQGKDALRGALESGGHDKYIDQPDLLSSASTLADGNNILGHLFGNKDVSRNVAALASNDTGIDQGTIKKALPLIATMAMGALNKNSSAGQKGGGLGGLLGGLMGGGDTDMDDLFSLAKKFF